MILTGIPRSGTTLATALLDRLPGVVALSEPIDPVSLRGMRREAIADAIVRWMAEERTSILTTGRARAKLRDGVVPEDMVAGAPDTDGLRTVRVDDGWIDVRERGLRPGFRLIVKHPGPFAVVLPELAARLPCVAVVRNPLATLLSWQTVGMPLRDGHSVNVEAVDGDLSRHLAAEPDRHRRQVILLGWWVSRFRRTLPDPLIVRYEEIIATGGRALAPAAPGAAQLDLPLASRNRSPLYDPDLVDRLADLLLSTPGDHLAIHGPEAVETLRAEWRRHGAARPGGEAEQPEAIGAIITRSAEDPVARAEGSGKR